MSVGKSNECVLVCCKAVDIVLLQLSSSVESLSTRDDSEWTKCPADENGDIPAFQDIGTVSPLAVALTEFVMDVVAAFSNSVPLPESALHQDVDTASLHVFSSPKLLSQEQPHGTFYFLLVLLSVVVYALCCYSLCFKLVFIVFISII